jgi:hypothetical protein
LSGSPYEQAGGRVDSGLCAVMGWPNVSIGQHGGLYLVEKTSAKVEPRAVPMEGYQGT